MSSVSAANAPAWETHKENAAPLMRGRNVATLGAHQSDVKDLKLKVTHYETLVRPSEKLNVTEMDGDPLAHWLSYIKFYQNSFPANTRESFLIMERCVRALVKMKYYFNDDRFVSVCAKYADKTKEPGAIFKYLHQQKVGSHTALFWIAWAFVAEKDNDFPFAEHIFKKGISKKAAPLQILKVRHQQFRRRMSRHWLNSSKVSDQLNDEYEDGEQNSRSRSTLGGISQDRLDRNDRSRSRVQQGSRQNNLTQRNDSKRSPSNRTNSVKNNSAFSIFVEPKGENAYLDQNFAENDRPVIVRDSERKKENTLEAERWNERGGLQASRKKMSSRSTGPLPAFSVFIDEECAVRNDRQEIEHSQQIDRQRQVRDERTFRERTGEGMAEKLVRDPVRYLRDPSRFASETTVDASVSQRHEEHEMKTKTERKNRAGFDKRLLKNRKGEVQCFEEVRAKTGSFTLLVGTSNNFNLLQNMIKADQSSHMDLDGDEEEYMDASMSESLSRSIQTSARSNKIFGKERIESKSEGKILLQPVDVSFGTGLNQTAISNASSTINEIDNFGLSGKQEEETINTKFAMRELSMMFSSPNFEVDSTRKRRDLSRTSRINESVAHDNIEVNALFGNVGDGIMLNNSICNTAIEDTRGEERSFPKTKLRKDYESTTGEKFQKVNKNDNVGITIFQDKKSLNEEKVQTGTQSGIEFQIYDEGNENIVEPKIYDEDVNRFQIYVEEHLDTEEQKMDGKNDSENSNQKRPIKENFEMKLNEDKRCSNLFEKGDTASISDAIALLEDGGKPSDGAIGDEGEETADLSLFNEIFQDESKNQDSTIPEHIRNPESSLALGLLNQNKRNIQTIGARSSKRLKRLSNDGVRKKKIDYKSHLNHSTQIALRRLQTKSDIISDSHAPLLSLLLSKGKAFHLPKAVLPQQLRRKRISNTDQVALGKHGGLRLKRELGEGAYGRVILMNTSESNQSDTIAIKVQKPTGCLAWEYTVLQRLEQRLAEDGKEDTNYPFPRPMSFISIADGGILSMSAASESGLTLVDLSNFYKLTLNKTCVPELVALHYISIAIGIVEKLHWHGRILHCDIKPDNFVLSTPAFSRNSDKTKSSNLTLVDFGRAVDLAEGSDFLAEDVRNIMFNGTTGKKSMQCIAMRNGQSWSYDADTYGICDCAYVLLFGKDLEIKRGKGNRWRQSEELKRYWNKDIWNNIFDSLLNLDEVSGSAIGSRASSLSCLRKKIDTYLEIDTQNLHKLLAYQANNLPDIRENIK
mmetsp:Transcript_20600/g.23120  ORF Transcript_20600/g.23120 Transcript_20600/m.23120 type:complete len:1260 (-) Transcript_20600:14-3793(-)